MAQVLVGVDGSRSAQVALRWAGAYAAAMEVGLKVVHVHLRRFAEVSPAEHEKLLAERRALLEGEWIRPVADLGVQVETSLVEGDPRDILLVTAVQEPPAMVVLGRSGTGGAPGFLHLGSVVEQLAHHLDVPLAVIPADAAPGFDPMVVGVDGSDSSAAAVHWSGTLAARTGATVLAVHVAEPPVEWTVADDSRNWRRSAEDEIDGWTAPMRSHDVRVEHIVTEHLRPADGLLGVATARSAGMLVMGTRGTGGFAGLRFGGVAMKVLHRATMPLVLVPPAG